MTRKAHQDDYQKTALRVPRELHAKIIDAAKKNNRTMNAEIVERLGASFDKDVEIDSFSGLSEESAGLLNRFIESLKKV